MPLNTPLHNPQQEKITYVTSHLAYKSRTDLQIYKKSDLESNFIEIINPKKSNGHDQKCWTYC